MNWRDVFARLRAAVSPAEDALDVIEASERVPAGLDRRAFLRAALIGTAAVGLVDVDRLLWVPGEKTIVVPTLRVLRDLQTGISIKFIQGWDIARASRVTRMDACFGVPSWMDVAVEDVPFAVLSRPL